MDIWPLDRDAMRRPVTRHTWEEAVVQWLLETKHKATHEADKTKLRWLDPYLGGKQLGDINRTLIERKLGRRHLNGAGIEDINWHDLRHTFAT